MAKGDRITATRFNAARTTAVRVMGVGTGNEGYGQQVVSSTVSPGQQISSSFFNNLRTDIVKAYTHQTNSDAVNTIANENVPSTLQPPNLQIVSGGTITNALVTQYENFANNIFANRAAAAPAQLTETTITTTQRTTNWGGTAQVQVLTHTVTLTFNGYTQSGLTVSAADHARVFFNAGGQINITASRTGGTSDNKNTTWSNMLSGFGTLSFRNTGTTISGSLNPTGSVTNIGFVNLTVGGASQQILFQPGPAGVYAENDYNVRVSRPTSNTLAFIIEFRDDDVGDRPVPSPPPPFGPLVDETVTGTLSSIVRANRPFGVNVDVPAPTGVSSPASL